MYLATANAAGQPYIQHRGGPPGFLRVLDDETFGFADFAGNKQYITLGNLQENVKTHVFLMDYAHRRRIKIWGTLSAVEGDDALDARFKPEGYKAGCADRGAGSGSRATQGDGVAVSHAAAACHSGVYATAA
jgi:predicted pyridoxine 5'-phosphate oxidase superfamily flavin-nucleotide-binding protein